MTFGHPVFSKDCHNFVQQRRDFPEIVLGSKCASGAPSLKAVSSGLEIGMLGQVANKEDIRAMLQGIHRGSPVVDFVVDVLMSDENAFFPAARLADGTSGHFVEVARLAATELRIAETSLSGPSASRERPEGLRHATTQCLWARLNKLRGRAQQMVTEFHLLPTTPDDETGPEGQAPALRIEMSGPLVSLLQARAAA